MADLSKASLCGDVPDVVALELGEPQVAIPPSGDTIRLLTPSSREGERLEGAGWGQVHTADQQQAETGNTGCFECGQT